MWPLPDVAVRTGSTGTYLLRQSYRNGGAFRHRIQAKPLPSTTARNQLEIKSSGGTTSEMTTTPTALQQRAFDLLQVSYRM